MDYGRFWEDDRTWLGDYVDLPPPDEPAPGKVCAPVICPPFGEIQLDVSGFCICHDLAPGQLYAPGCVVHDPAAIEA